MAAKLSIWTQFYLSWTQQSVPFWGVLFVLTSLVKERSLFSKMAEFEENVWCWNKILLSSKTTPFTDDRIWQKCLMWKKILHFIKVRMKKNFFFCGSSHTLSKTISWFLTHIWTNRWLIGIDYRQSKARLLEIICWITSRNESPFEHFLTVLILEELTSWNLVGALNKRGMFKSRDKFLKIDWCLCYWRICKNLNFHFDIDRTLNLILIPWHILNQSN